MKKSQSYSITAEELSGLGKDQIPGELVSGRHLIYSSPATLAFNSPGAQGYGVKRAALAIPGSVMLLVAPGCCGRNTTIYSEIPGYENRFFYLLMDETDVVTGRHLKKIPDAVASVCESLDPKPSVVMICITCVDALLGTDMERVCRKAQEKVGIFVLPSYMYALTREGRKPPMVHVRQSIYSLLKKQKRRRTSVNILGFFGPLCEDCELYELLAQAGIKKVREIARCESFSEYLMMGEANFNLVLNPEARFAASDLSKRLGIPAVELARLYRIGQIRKQYALFAAALGIRLDDSKYYEEAERAVRAFKQKYPDLVFSIGEGCNANAFELAYALLSYGFSVAEIFADPQPADFVYIDRIAAASPDTRIYSNLEPTMLCYDLSEAVSDITIGKDAAFYHPDTVNLMWSDDAAPFGYRGVIRFFNECDRVLSSEREGGFRQETERGDDAVIYKHAFIEEEVFRQKLLPEGEGTSSRPVKGLRKYIAPFAPDQSGASAVFTALGGMVIILDAGGCAGNICGFDEPRWFESRSAIFSAGLRDMDAILGRDDRLVEKVEMACRSLEVKFVAIVGTPVPSVIATDYRALQRMIEKKTGLPVITVDTNGMELYDAGVQKALLTLFGTFAVPPHAGPTDTNINTSGGSLPSGECTRMPGESGQLTQDYPVKEEIIGILGMTPLDVPLSAANRFREYYGKQGDRKVFCYCMGDDLAAIRQAGCAGRNVVVSPSALPAARYLEKTFAIPYECSYPLETLPDWESIREQIARIEGSRILIAHQQVLAHSLREYINGVESSENQNKEIVVASWFGMDQELFQEGDVHIREENAWIRLVKEGGFDCIIADSLFFAAVPDYSGQWINLEHFAVSGKRI